MPFTTFELNGLNRLAFSVADDPFYKSQRSRFYPEVIVMNMKGEIKARVNPFTREYKKRGIEAVSFEEDFRESRLKINDDKRVHINLTTLAPKNRNDNKSKLSQSASSLSNTYSGSGKMILLTVKVSNEAFRKQPPSAGEFDKAWYRLVNNDNF